jgi:hypothetical protein
MNNSRRTGQFGTKRRTDWELGDAQFSDHIAQSKSTAPDGWSRSVDGFCLLALRRQESNGPLGPVLPVNSLRKGNTNDLSSSRWCSTQIRDVEPSIRAEGHTRWYGESGRDIFYLSIAVQAHYLAFSRSREARGR